MRKFSEQRRVLNNVGDEVKDVKETTVILVPQRQHKGYLHGFFVPGNSVLFNENNNNRSLGVIGKRMWNSYTAKSAGGNAFTFINLVLKILVGISSFQKIGAKFVDDLIFVLEALVKVKKIGAYEVIDLVCKLLAFFTQLYLFNAVEAVRLGRMCDRLLFPGSDFSGQLCHERWRQGNAPHFIWNFTLL